MLEKKTLAEIVNLKPAAASVFEKYHLDFCCKGKRTLEEACKNDKLTLKLVSDELEHVFETSSSTAEERVEEQSIDNLCAYIRDHHHAYVRRSSPLILAHLEKIVNKHGSRHPELKKILSLFTELADDMAQHMYKEEAILFARIEEVAHASETLHIHLLPDGFYLASPMTVMEMEHEQAGKLLTEIRELTSNYLIPEDACTTYKLAFRELQDFEHDLHRHVHLENNVLFPKALEVQQKVKCILNN